MSEVEPIRKCPQCGIEIGPGKAVSREIIYHGFNALGKRAVLRKRIDFCSSECGGYYQMGCEG